MRQTHTCHYGVLHHVPAEATTASSLWRGNTDEEQELTVSDCTYWSQSLLYFDFVLIKQSIISKQNSTQDVLGPSTYPTIFLLPWNLASTGWSQGNHPSQKSKWGKWKNQDAHSAVSSKLKRSLRIIPTSCLKVLLPRYSLTNTFTAPQEPSPEATL